MFTTEEILSIIRDKTAGLKEIKGSVDGIPSKNKERIDPPAFHPTYKKSVELFQKIRPHSEDGYFPNELFSKKAPNQKPEEWDYCKEVFKITGTPTTSYWAKALSTLGRVWNEKNYSIKYPEITSVELTKYQPKRYFEKGFPAHKSIEDFFKEIVTPVKIDDPNAWVCLDIQESPETEPSRPYVCVIPCFKVIGFDPGRWLLTLSDDKSVVEFGGRRAKEGIVLEFRDSFGLYRIEQAGKRQDMTFSEPELVARWDLEYLPCQRLKGMPKYEEGKIYFESRFSPAIPALNVALLDSNTLQVSKNNGAFPERWEYVDDCDAPGCDAGFVWDNERENKHTCGVCNGTGRKNWSSPLSVIEIPVPNTSLATRGDTSKDKVGIPPAGYIPKEQLVEMLKFLDEQVQRNCEKAFAFLNIDVSNSDAKGSDTALGKQIDREELFSFLMQLSNELFSLLQFFIDACGEVRYRNAWTGCEVGYPQNFSIRSDTDLTEEIGTANTAGLPTMVKQALYKEYMSNRFNSQSDVERRFALIIRVDRLNSFSAVDIAVKLANGTAATWEAVMHDSIDMLLDVAENEDANFWNKDLAEQKAILEEKAKGITSTITPARVNVEEIIA